jgi:hypothetical protein
MPYSLAVLRVLILSSLRRIWISPSYGSSQPLPLIHFFEALGDPSVLKLVEAPAQRGSTGLVVFRFTIS